MAAIFSRPQVLILDEPFNFLDPSSQNILKHMLTEYNQETGATILISSHNLQHTVDISTSRRRTEHAAMAAPSDAGRVRSANEPAARTPYISTRRT